MSSQTKIEQILEQQTPETGQNRNGISIGTVIDINDPQQMNRIRVVVPAWGDDFDTTPVGDIPWAECLAPFGGTTTRLRRGCTNENSEGEIAYGFNATPKHGTQVAVFCKDGNPNERVWFGAFIGSFLTHTLPQGRFMEGGKIGPFTSDEMPMQPMHTNLRNAFGDPEIQLEDDANGNKRKNTYEWFSRAVENQVSAVDPIVINRVGSKKSDDKGEEIPGTNGELGNRKGYQISRSRPNLKFENTDGNYEPQIVSLTTPGSHSIVMDDCEKNERIRIKTTTGHQIIMDDTNERIYISTAKGNNWIEMDELGNIDIYSSGRISMHSDKDINMTANESIRMSAKNIHMVAKEDIRQHALQNIHNIASEKISIKSEGTTTGKKGIDISSAGYLRLSTIEDIDFTSQGKFDVSAQGNLNFKTSGNINNEGSKINIKGPTDIEGATKIGGGSIDLDGTTTITGTVNALVTDALKASIANTSTGVTVAPSTASSPAANVESDPITPIDPFFAYTTNRVPIHEPWGRIMVDKGVKTNDPAKNFSDKDTTANDIDNILAMVKNSSILELSYDDPNVGKEEFGELLDPRQLNTNWKR